MGLQLTRVDVRALKPNEERDLEVVLVPETRALIHGTVQFPTGLPVEGAVVKLFKRTGDPCRLSPIGFTFTDDCGQFMFGVESGVDFVLKVLFFEREVPEPYDP